MEGSHPPANEMLQDTLTTFSPPEEELKTTAGVSAGIISAIILLVVFVAICIVRHKRNLRRKSSQSELETGENSEDDTTAEPKDSDIKMDALNQIMRQRSQQEDGTTYWEYIDVEVKTLVSSVLIDIKLLSLGRVLGKGQFGCVYEGTLGRDDRASNDYGALSHDKVAIKTLKGDNIDHETVEAFLKEGMIMKDFDHRNVLRLIGVAIGDFGVPMIVLPFMKYGSLKKYIGDPKLKLTVRELLEFGLQVAHGMNYLADQKFVHRDLAARNCMLDHRLTVKVADFGLSRDIYTKDYYRTEDKSVKLPVKWMALESLTKAVFTTKSDVWSFGVLLWELLTRGATPYPDVSNWDIRNYVQAGRRMHQPENCPDDVYDMMLLCWRERPDERPWFVDIIRGLSTVLDNSGDRSPREDDSDTNYVNYLNLYMNIEVPEAEPPAASNSCDTCT